MISRLTFSARGVGLGRERDRKNSPCCCFAVPAQAVAFTFNQAKQQHRGFYGHLLSFKILNAAWATQCKSGMEKLVLAAMADYCDEKGFCWPSTTTLAKRCSITRKSVMEQIAKLESAGLLAVERRGWKGNRYTLHCHPQLQPPVTHGDNPMSPTVTKAVTHGYTIRQEPSVQPSGEGKQPPVVKKLSGPELILRDGELKRVLADMRRLRARNDSGRWAQDDITEFHELKAIKKELMAVLGLRR